MPAGYLLLKFSRKNSFGAVSCPDRVPQETPVSPAGVGLGTPWKRVRQASPLSKDDKVQVNTPDSHWESVAIAGADRCALYPWHMQQQRNRLILILASDGELDLVLLRQAKAVHPRTGDVYPKSCHSLAGVHRRPGDARLEISHQAIALPYLFGDLLCDYLHQ